jgi:hypothetical protein
MNKYFKIEVLAILMITLMLGISYLIKVRNEQMERHTSAKELEIFDSVTVEVNASALTSKLFADYTVKIGDELKMKQLLYTGYNARLLKSNYGRSVGHLLYLDENVSMLQDNGFYYKAEHTVYDKKRGFFYTTSPFVAYLSKGTIIHGVNMTYDIQKKITTAENVNALFFTGP